MALNLPNWDFGQNAFNPFESLSQGFGKGLEQRREQELFNRDVQTKDYDNMINAAKAMYAPRSEEANIFNTENQARLYGQKADLYPEEARALMNQQNASARNLGSQAQFQEIQNKMVQDSFNKVNGNQESQFIPKGVVIGTKYDPLVGENRKRDAEKRMEDAYAMSVLGEKIERRLGQAEQIFAENPDLADTWTKAILNPEKKDELFYTLLRNTTDQRKREAIEMIDKIAADLITFQIDAKRSGRTTDLARNMEAARKLHAANSPNANTFIIKNMRGDLEGVPEMSQAIQEALSQGLYLNTTNPKLYAKQKSQSDEMPFGQPEKQDLGNPFGEMITLRNKKTGQTETVTLEEARRRGAVQ